MTGKASRGGTAQGPLPDPLFRRRWTAPLSPALALVAVMVALLAASPAAADHSLRSGPGVTERDSTGRPDRPGRSWMKRCRSWKKSYPTRARQPEAAR